MWRSVVISKAAKLSLWQNQLLIKQEEEYTIPLEDIAVVLIECKEVVLTVPLLSALAQYGVTLLTCDDSFLPCGQWLPLAQHWCGLRIITAQSQMQDRFKKKLWTLIVQQKIKNQAIVLNYTGHDKAAQRLYHLAENMKMGDKTNSESEAAAVYFRVLFGREFNRRKEHHINHHLNYGYSIMRAAIARIIVRYGFVPYLGIFHHNERNAFNLADDLIEPYRALVDFYIYQQLEKNKLSEELTPKSKTSLIRLLNYQIRLKERNYSVLSAMDKSINSLQSAVLNQEVNLLILPQLIYLQEHQYE